MSGENLLGTDRNTSSQDQFNDGPGNDPQVPDPVSARGPLDHVALAVATFGVGLIPLAPGTWGSLAGVGVYLLVRFISGQIRGVPFGTGLLVTIVVVTISGVWAGSQVERLTGRKDPGKVVVDEVAGQLVALLPLAISSLPPSRTWIMVSFIFFRFFDITKPYPARKMEQLHGGLGIMCDDLIAGLYAAAMVIAGIELTTAIRGL